MIIYIAKYIVKRMNKDKLENFIFSNFDKLSPKLKEVSILKYGELVLKEQGLKNYKFEIRDLENQSINGRCYPKDEDYQDSEKVVLNKFHIHNDELFDIIGTIYHECKHAIQNIILESSKNNQLYQNEYTKSLDYCKNKTNIDINFCNFHLKNVSLHIKSNSDLFKISEMFYHLNISEREAFLEEKNQSFLFQNKYSFIKSKLNVSYIQNYINSFNKLYHCNLNQEEVFNIIDQCYENLVENKAPSHNKEGNLLATVMYDMCLVSGYNSGVLSKEEVINLSTLKEKQKQLAKYDYFVYGVKYDGNLFSLKEQQLYLDNPSLLKNLSKTEQNTNYLLIWKVISNNKDKPIEYFNELLKDKETFFKQIVENETSREMCSELLTDLFGEEFTKYASKDSNIKE